MMYGVYHGPFTPLLGKRALLRQPTEKIYDSRQYVMAQFDFGPGMNENNDGGPLNYLCFGWHPFGLWSFTLYPSVEEAACPVEPSSP